MNRRLVIFGCALIVLATGVALNVPAVAERLERIQLRLLSWWRDQQPQEIFVAPPAEAEAQSSDQPTAAFAQPPSTQAADTSAEPPEEWLEKRAVRRRNTSSRTPTPQVAAQPTVAPRPAHPDLPAQFRLSGFRHEYQKFNNCGPATLSMLLSHFDYAGSQKDIAPVLKPTPVDYNVSPGEIADYIREQAGLEAIYRVNGNLELLKALVANGLPVMAEMWFTPRPNDGMGHYRLVIGYSDQEARFFTLDSYSGPSVSLTYDEFDATWKVFNRTYIVAYRGPQADLIAELIGDAAHDQTMWRQSLSRADAEIGQNANDVFAWFNRGAALHALGAPVDAARAFDRARRIGLPWRMLWYQFAPFEAYLAAGRTQDVLDLTAANLRRAIEMEESHYYRGRALEALGNLPAAIEAYREAVRFNPNFKPAVKALQAVDAGQ